MPDLWAPGVRRIPARRHGGIAADGICGPVTWDRLTTWGL